MAAVPSLRQHKRGHYFYRIGGKDVYLGFDFGEAQRKHKAAFPPEQFYLSNAAPASPKAAGKAEEKTVGELASVLFSITDASASKQKAKNYRYDLADFLDTFGSTKLSALDMASVLQYRNSIVAAYSPWTVKGKIAIIKRLLSLADELQWVDRPYRLGLLKAVPIGETKSKAWSIDLINERIKNVYAQHPMLAYQLRLQFLTCLRPYAVPELANRRGTWDATNAGVFILDRSKTEKKTGAKGRVVLSDAAMQQLDMITTAYQSGKCYREGCKRYGGFAPHALRHSAATALVGLGVSREYIEVALGHIEPLVQRTYRPPAYKETRMALERLAELVPLPASKQRQRQQSSRLTHAAA